MNMRDDIVKVLNRIEECVHDKLTVADLSSDIFLSESHLQKIFNY